MASRLDRPRLTTEQTVSDSSDLTSEWSAECLGTVRTEGSLWRLAGASRLPKHSRSLCREGVAGVIPFRHDGRMSNERRASSNLQYNREGVAMGPVYLTDEEFTELIDLIFQPDEGDEPNEALLSDLGHRLMSRRKRLRSAITKKADAGG